MHSSELERIMNSVPGRIYDDFENVRVMMNSGSARLHEEFDYFRTVGDQAAAIYGNLEHGLAVQAARGAHLADLARQATGNVLSITQSASSEQLAAIQIDALVTAAVERLETIRAEWDESVSSALDGLYQPLLQLRQASYSALSDELWSQSEFYDAIEAIKHQTELAYQLAEARSATLRHFQEQDWFQQTVNAVAEQYVQWERLGNLVTSTLPFDFELTEAGLRLDGAFYRADEVEEEFRKQRADLKNPSQPRGARKTATFPSESASEGPTEGQKSKLSRFVYYFILCINLVGDIDSVVTRGQQLWNWVEGAPSSTCKISAKELQGGALVAMYSPTESRREIVLLQPAPILVKAVRKRSCMVLVEPLGTNRSPADRYWIRSKYLVRPNLGNN